MNLAPLAQFPSGRPRKVPFFFRRIGRDRNFTLLIVGPKTGQLVVRKKTNQSDASPAPPPPVPPRPPVPPSNPSGDSKDKASNGGPPRAKFRPGAPRRNGPRGFRPAEQAPTRQCPFWPPPKTLGIHDEFINRPTVKTIAGIQDGSSLKQPNTLPGALGMGCKRAVSKTDLLAPGWLKRNTQKPKSLPARLEGAPLSVRGERSVNPQKGPHEVEDPPHSGPPPPR